MVTKRMDSLELLRNREVGTDFMPEAMKLSVEAFKMQYENHAKGSLRLAASSISYRN